MGRLSIPFSMFILFLLLVLVFFCLFSERFKLFKDLTVSVCIPLIPRDIRKLPRMIQSIAKQTVLPEEVVVALSSAVRGDKDRTQKVLAANLPKNVAWKVVSTSAQHYAGPNRKRAAEASSGDIIAFVDGDDEMLPRRIQLIKEAFQKNPSCVCVLTTAPKTTMTKRRKFPREGSPMKMVKNVKKGGLFTIDRFRKPKGANPTPPGVRIRHGIPSVRREVIHTISQSNRRRGQDQDFLHAILDHYGKEGIILIREPLYIYRYNPHKYPYLKHRKKKPSNRRDK